MLFIPAVAPGLQQLSTSAGRMNGWVREARQEQFQPPLVLPARSSCMRAQRCTLAMKDDVTEAAVEHRGDELGIWGQTHLGPNPSSATCSLCDLRPVT